MGSEEQSLLNEVAARDTSLLDADSIPNANQSLTCFSCDEPMSGLYCYTCGNKNDNYRRSVWSLGSELFQSLTALEGRIWRSLFSLIVKPGQMARDYADGARQKWTSPIRLFLATSLLLFGYIAFSGTQLIALGDVESGQKPSNYGILYESDGKDYTQRLLFFVRQSQIILPPDDSLAALREGLDITFGDGRSSDSLQDAIDGLDRQIENREPGIAKDALIETRNGLMNDLAKQKAKSDSPENETQVSAENSEPEDETEMTFNGLNGETIMLDSQGVTELYSRVLRHPEVINNQLNTKLKWAMFFMMPLAMFMGAMFIRGRDTAMLYDHLVHAAYVHSFSFLLLFAFILLAQFTSIRGLALIYTIILMIYLPVSAKRAFKRGWFKSVLTAYGVGSVYTLIMFIIAIVIVGLALGSVVQDISQRNMPPAITQSGATGA